MAIAKSHPALQRKLAIVATTPDDAHAWNLIGVAFELEDRGYLVENLGPNTPEDVLAERIRDLRPDLVVVSSINGHGALSIPRLLDTLAAYQVKRSAPIVVGGKLTTDPGQMADLAETLIEAGVHSVLKGEGAWQDFDKLFKSEDTAGAAKTARAC